MLSIALTKSLVYGALALSLLCALATIVGVVWGIARARQRRWPWALAVPIAVSTFASWLWLYPSFVIGSVLGGEVAALLGHGLSPVADAALMAVGIGVGLYLVFTVPVAVLGLVVGFGVTTPRAASESRAPAVPRRVILPVRWVSAIKGLALLVPARLSPGPR